jgi:hypothetical protein
MKYEDGMSVDYDAISQVPTICFRGHEFFATISAKPSEAIAIGEQVCRNLGWQALPPEREPLQRHA